MEQFILISCIERDAILSFHASEDSARRQMLTECADAINIRIPAGSTPEDIRDAIEICTDSPHSCGINERTAYVTEGVNHNNYDWTIVPVKTTDDGRIMPL
jgi:hypothetical protein